MIEEWINANIVTFITIVVIIAIWDGVWKLTAMWRASQRKSTVWYIVLAVFNTIGILPIIYFIITRKKELNHKDRNHDESPRN